MCGCACVCVHMCVCVCTCMCAHTYVSRQTHYLLMWEAHMAEKPTLPQVVSQCPSHCPMQRGGSCWWHRDGMKVQGGPVFDFSRTWEYNLETLLSIKMTCTGTFPFVQWLRSHAPNAGGPGSIPGQETRALCSQINIFKTIWQFRISLWIQWFYNLFYSFKKL